MSFSNEFVSMQCPHCGGKVEIKQATVDESFIDNGDTFVYIGSTTGEKIVCSHCGTEFQRKQTISLHFEGKGNLSVNTGGAAFIGGSVNTGGGDFVGRNKTVVITHKIKW